jgi:UPF0755 protein
VKYSTRPQKRKWPRRLLFVAIVIVVILGIATIVARRVYQRQLGPENSSDQQVQLVTISTGESADQIAVKLQGLGIIHSAWAFELYVSSKEDRGALEAGQYKFSPSEGIQEIVAQLSHGKIAAKLVTVLPGQRVGQIEQSFINDGFSASEVSAAFSNPSQYTDEPIMSIESGTPSLEGMLFPDSFQKVADTSPQQIVRESLSEMNKELTPSIREAFTSEGLTPYQALTLASIVEQEVPSQNDRNEVAQVFISRLAQGIPLGSDVTADYGSVIAGQSPNLNYASPYNTLLVKGLPPTPIGTVSASSIDAVAHPAKTQWLFFVTGDNGTTYFSKTLAQHEALTQEYCHKLCDD